MSFKSIHNIHHYEILLAITFTSSVCQSIPDTDDKTDVIQNVISYDQQLTTNTKNDIQQIEATHQKKTILTELEAV